MNFKRVLSNLLILVTSIYMVLHVYQVCPLNEPIDYQYISITDGKFDPICYSAHQIYDRAQPIVSYVSNIYDNSPIKPYVDESSKILSPYVNQVSDYINKLSTEISAYREANEEYILNESYKTMSKVIATITNFFKGTIYPVVSDCIKYCYKISKYYSRKAQIQSYLYFNIYIKPSLLKLSKKFMESSFGHYYIKIENSNTWKLIVKYIKLIFSYINQSINYIIEKIKYAYNISMAFKDTDSYKIVELKQNFLRDYAKYLPNNLKLEITTTSSLSSTTINISSSSSLSSSSSSSIKLNISSQPTNVVIPTSEKFDSLLKNTIKSANDDFNNQVNELTDKFRSKLHNQFQPELKKLSENVNSGYNNIHKLLDRINEIKDKSHDLYVSREIYRNELTLKKDEIENHVEEIQSKIDKFIELYLDEILKIRINILDTLEEFADSSLNAYSSEIISNGDDWKEWKKYKELKNSIIKFRDDLVSRKPNEDLNNSLNTLKHDIHLLLNEAGSYMSILRAKANIEFQSREAEEKRSQEEQEETQNETIQNENITNTKEEQFNNNNNDNDNDNDNNNDDDYDEDFTETIIQTRYVTKTIDINKDAKTKPIEENIPSEIVVDFVKGDSDEVKVVFEAVEIESQA
jgi:uncharacterized protein YukE